MADRRSLAGLLILAMIAMTLVNGFVPAPLEVLPVAAGLAGWIAAVLLYPETRTRLCGF